MLDSLPQHPCRLGQVMLHFLCEISYAKSSIVAVRLGRDAFLPAKYSQQRQGIMQILSVLCTSLAIQYSGDGRRSNDVELVVPEYSRPAATMNCGHIPMNHCDENDWTGVVIRTIARMALLHL